MTNLPTHEGSEQRGDKLGKKLSSQIRKNLDRFLLLAIEQSSEGIAISDLEGNLEYVNSAFAYKHGYSPDELIGKNLSIFHTPQQISSVEQANKQLKKTGTFKGEIWHLRQDGTLFPGLMHNSVINDEKNKPIGMMGTLRDISDIKQAEEALKKSQKELERRVKERTSELEIMTNGLKEINTAMTVLLKKREEDKIELEDNVLTNVKELLEPYFEKIKRTKLDDQQEVLLSIIESNLNEIISPFTRKMSLKYSNLTPKEIQIANMTKHGNTSIKIAKIMNISPRTVDTHKKNIRRKIGLRGKRTNLRSYLLSLH